MANPAPRSETSHRYARSIPMSGPIDIHPTDTSTTATSGDVDGRSPRRPSSSRNGPESNDLRERVYAFNDLSRFERRDRLMIRAASIMFYLLIRVIGSTLRWEVIGREHLDSVISRGHRPIFTFWHVCILSATWFWRKRGIVVMSSTSRDGAYTGRVIKRFGYGTVSGSSTRGGGRALADMAECLEKGFEVAFTIDGPRGPVYVAKPGAVTLARHTGQPILPFHIAASRYFEIPSWDRLQIPWPFSRAAAVIGEPIYVPRHATREEVGNKQTALQSSLERLREDASLRMKNDNRRNS